MGELGGPISNSVTEPVFKREWFDRPPPPRVREGPPQLYEHCGLVALWYPDYVEIVECNPKVDEAGFIIGWEVPDL